MVSFFSFLLSMATQGFTMTIFGSDRNLRVLMWFVCLSDSFILQRYLLLITGHVYGDSMITRLGTDTKVLIFITFG